MQRRLETPQNAKSPDELKRLMARQRASINIPSAFLVHSLLKHEPQLSKVEITFVDTQNENLS